MGNTVNINIIQYVAIVGSIAFFLLIVNFVRKKKIKEEYSLLWFIFSIVFIIISLWRKLLDLLAYILGVAYPPAALLLIFILVILLILIQFSITISKLSDQNKNMAQELGLLRAEVNILKRNNKIEH